MFRNTFDSDYIIKGHLGIITFITHKYPLYKAFFKGFPIGGPHWDQGTSLPIPWYLNNLDSHPAATRQPPVPEGQCPYEVTWDPKNNNQRRDKPVAPKQQTRGKSQKPSILNRVFHYKPSILGYPYFWKHPSRWWQLKYFLECSSRTLGFHDPILTRTYFFRWVETRNHQLEKIGGEKMPVGLKILNLSTFVFFRSWAVFEPNEGVGFSN